MTAKKLYSIKAVSKRTGLSTHVIRVWERRYGAVTPARSDSNRRLYSEEEVQRLEWLQKATSIGHSIGNIANLSTEEIQNLVQTHDRAVAAAGDRGRPMQRFDETQEPESVQTYLEACVEAVKQLDDRTLESALMHASVTVSQPVLIEKIVIPLIHKIGDAWRDGTIRVMNEHMASGVIRTFLSNMYHAADLPAHAPVLVITTAVGQLHELGAMIVAVVSAAEGWQVTYLGPNLPSEEIAGAAEKNHARAVCLSFVYPSDDPRIISELSRLRQFLPPEVTIIAGGRAVHSYQTVLNEISAEIITDLYQFRERLESLRMSR